MRQDGKRPQTRAAPRKGSTSSRAHEIRRSTDNAKNKPAPPRAGAEPGDRTGQNDRIN
jgi:hypothetical protein